MQNKTLINLENDLILKSQNIEYNNQFLNDYLDKQKDNKVKIYTGSISEGTSCVVKESINDFKFLLVQPGTLGTWVLIPIIPNSNHLRGTNFFSNSNNLETFSIIATKTSDGLSFNLAYIGNYTITENGIKNVHSVNTITNIYGIK